MKLVTVAPIVLVAGLAVLAVPARAQDVKEPRTGVSFAVKQDGMTLFGVGVRTKTFLKVKVYAAGFYVADAALAGPLAVHRGRTGTPQFYRDLVWGDFPKAIVMKFVRDTTAAQIRDAFYEALPGVDRGRLDLFASHFGTPRNDQTVVVRWGPGGVIETVAVRDRPYLSECLQRAFRTHKSDVEPNLPDEDYDVDISL